MLPRAGIAIGHGIGQYRVPGILTHGQIHHQTGGAAATSSPSQPGGVVSSAAAPG